MPRSILISRSSAAGVLVATFALGCLCSHTFTKNPTCGTLRPPPPPSIEERGPPTKQELGQCGWTLLHTMAANYPEDPTGKQRARAESFLRALGDLYPCPTCAAHLRGYMAEHPVTSASRQQLSMWLCGAHNDVNVRNGKEAFYCDLGVLDARWKDCGCGNKTKTSAS